MTTRDGIRWEYKVEKVSIGGMIDPNIDKVDARWLNPFGTQGWELVTVIPMNRGGGLTVAAYFVFKRIISGGDTST